MKENRVTRILGSARRVLRFRAPRKVFLAVTAMLLLAGGPASAQTKYRLTDLGVEDVYWAAPIGINDSGQMAIFSESSADGHFHALVWDGQELHDLGMGSSIFGGAGFYEGRPINNLGHVTGSYEVADPGAPGGWATHAFLWDGTMTDLGPGAGQAINDADHVAGAFKGQAALWDGSAWYVIAGAGNTSDINASSQVTGATGAPCAACGWGHAYLTEGPKLLNVGLADETASVGRKINSAGWVAGTSDNHAIVWNGTTTLDLGTLDETWSEATLITEYGWVAGRSLTAGDAGPHAFLWDGSTKYDLGTLGGTESSPRAITNSALSIGGSTLEGDSEWHAFLSGGIEGMVDLNDLIVSDDPLKPYVTLTFADVVNAGGDIIGAEGYDSRYEGQRVYLVSPDYSDWGPQGYRLTDVGVEAAAVARPTGINNAGQLAILVKPLDGSADRTLVWDGQALHDVGALYGGGGSTHPASTRPINDLGQVTGTSYVWNSEASEWIAHAYVWDGATMKDLGPGSGIAINNAGHVAGTSNGSAALWDGSKWQAFGTGEAYDLNESSKVTGSSGGHAFLWDRTYVRNIGLSGEIKSWGMKINDAGWATGALETAGGQSHAFLWNGSATLDLGTLGGVWSGARLINEAGWVAGQSQTSGGEQHAFLWDGSVMQDLGTLGGYYSFPYALNNSGHVAGGSTLVYSSETRAFLYDGTGMHNLNDLVASADPLKPYVTLTYADAMNDGGQIGVEGYDSRKTGQRVYLATPVTEEAPVGVDVGVAPLPASDPDAGSLLLTFESVEEAGTVTATRLTPGDPEAPPQPGAFDFAGDVFEIESTAEFTGPVEICMAWSDPEVEPVMLHYVGGAWEELPTSRSGDGFHCATTSTFSPFVLAVPVVFEFDGFYKPVDNLPVANSVKGGKAIPVKFSLGEDRGLDIFKKGYPASMKINCSTSVPEDEIEETVTPGESDLSYDPASDTYTYVWKTSTAWSGTCRQFVLTLGDGSCHVANFTFK